MLERMTAMLDAVRPYFDREAPASPGAHWSRDEPRAQTGIAAAQDENPLTKG